MSFLFFNKDDKDDIVNTPLFGKLPRWRACCINYILISMIVFVLFLLFDTGGWWSVACGCFAFAFGYIFARWVY